ncbi:mitochondrial import inner membrane translocase subunit tim21 [Saitoella coloradoensis]
MSIRPQLPLRMLRNLEIAQASSVRSYATLGKIDPVKIPASEVAGSGRRSKAIVFKDDGRKKWSELGSGQKLTRATLTTGSLGIIVFGAVLLGTITYFFAEHVLMPTSETRIFGRAFDRVREDEEVRRVVGEGMSAYGESQGTRLRRNAPVASKRYTDDKGLDHMIMRFYVQGELGQGEVHLAMTKKPEEDEFVYKYLFVDTPGDGLPSKRIWLERDQQKKASTKRSWLGFSRA